MTPREVSVQLKAVTDRRAANNHRVGDVVLYVPTELRHADYPTYESWLAALAGAASCTVDFEPRVHSALIAEIDASGNVTLAVMQPSYVAQMTYEFDVPFSPSPTPGYWSPR